MNKFCHPSAKFDEQAESVCGAELKNQKNVEINHPLTIKPNKSTERTQNNEPLVDGISSAIAIDQSKKFLGGIYHPWRRFFARIVDFIFFGMFMGFLIHYLLQENVEWFIKAEKSNKFLIGIILILVWMPVEAGFLAAAGTTPAKWVFGISVISKDGKKLSYSSAIKRTFLVWIQGTGFIIPFVSFFTMLFAYRRLTKTGTTLWDTSVGAVVIHKKWGVVRAITAVLIVLTLLIILSLSTYK